MNEKLKAALRGNPDEYKSIPFWSWNNSLDENELVKQIEEMKSAGIGGFIMHARTGLKDEYLGEKWFSCIDACLKKAKELKMQAWIYDENGWPSGFVGGKLLENVDYRANYLEYRKGKFDKNAFAAYIYRKGKYLRVDKEIKGVKRYHNVYLKTSPANTDILKPEVVDAFIKETHERYYERFKDSFGRELTGFFTDEPQYFRWGTPYTVGLEKEFARDGENVKDGLIYLFIRGKLGYRFRQKYYRALNKLYVENFYKRIYDWCKERGCKLTGHSLGEEKLYSQMWGAADVMTTYEYEDVPAIDWLGRDCGTELAPKQIASVAAQLGKTRILTESFACSGYDVTPKELKSIGDFQYFNGVNALCQHLYPYSVSARGKIDHPPIFGAQAGWQKGFKTLNDYFTRLGYIISETEEICDIAIIHPQRSVWLDYLRAADESSVHIIERKFDKLLTKLRKKGVTYQFIDEEIFEKYGRTDDDTLVVGNRSYSVVLVPEIKTLSDFTYRALKRYKGKLCVLRQPEYIDGVRANVSLKGNYSFKELLNNASVKFRCRGKNCFIAHRKGDIGEFLFVKNLSSRKKGRVTIEGLSNDYLSLDLITLKEEPVADKLLVSADEGLILIKAKSNDKRSVVADKKDVTKTFTVAGLTQNYLVMDYARISKDGKNYSAESPIAGIMEALLREDYKGVIYVRQKFVLAERIPLTFIMEKTSFKTATLNHRNLSFKQSGYDVNFIEADISAQVIKGENEIEYSFDFYQHDGVKFALFDPLATESLKNCLYLDTSIEQSYLKGDFIVQKSGELTKRDAFPPVTDKLFKNGFPFFNGSVKYRGTIIKKENERIILTLDGRFMYAEIETERGKRLFVLDNKGDITDILKNGENEVEITLKSSLRNLFGPFHCKTAEPKYVSPYNFEFRGQWANNKKPTEYTDRYNNVPFGLKKVLVTAIKNADL